MPNNLRLSKTQRLCQPNLFKQILKSKSIVGRLCVIYYRLTPSGHSRLGIIASKRSLKLAIRRNQFKRITRECFRHHVEISACDIVVIARREAYFASKQEIRSCLDKLFQKLNPYCVTQLS